MGFPNTEVVSLVYFSGYVVFPDLLTRPEDSRFSYEFDLRKADSDGCYFAVEQTAIVEAENTGGKNQGRTPIEVPARQDPMQDLADRAVDDHMGGLPVVHSSPSHGSRRGAEANEVGTIEWLY